jgi:Raf kinase inhibitor-like YbhB/YbcL family protein
MILWISVPELSAQQSTYEQSHLKSMNLIDPAKKVKPMKILCADIPSNGSIPSKFTCDGLNINPPLEVQDIPTMTKCFALIVDDPDARKETWVHWLVWNIPVSTQIKENSIPGKQGLNDFGQHNYGGPCPPSGTHHYYFKLYALDQFLNLPENADKKQLENAMKDHIVGKAELIGLYQKMKR